MSSRPVVLALVAGALVLGLLATSTVAVLASRRAAERQEQVVELTAEVARLEGKLEALEDELASARSDDTGGEGELDDLLGGLLGEGGGEGGGDLDGLLDGLLSGASGDIPGVRCMTPGEGGVDGLLGGLGGLLGDDGAAEGPDDPDAVVDVVTEQVADLRELDFAGEVDVAFLDDAELTAELEEILERDLDVDELAAQADVLVALRAIPPDADLVELSRELLTSQVAGFYSPEDERLVVRTPDDGALRAMDRITLAHELDHALVDQAIGLPDLDDDTDADAALARLAVVEGDATLLMNRWTLEHLSIADQLGLAGSTDVLGQQAQLEAFPHYLARELIFPYTAGLDLVCDRWLEGGWPAVDAAYASPPTTTAGVLFPERADEEPAAAPALEAPSGATERLDDTFGAAPLLWLFEAPGGDEDAALSDPVDRAAAWGGGEVRLWDVGGDPVVGLALTDRQAGDPALCTSVTEWYAAAAPEAQRDGGGDEVRFVGGDTAAVLRCEGDAVRLGIAPDVTTAAAVVGSR